MPKAKQSYDIFTVILLALFGNRLYMLDVVYMEPFKCSHTWNHNAMINVFKGINVSEIMSSIIKNSIPVNISEIDYNHISIYIYIYIYM